MSCGSRTGTRVALNLPDLLVRGIERRRERGVHLQWVIAFHEHGIVSVPNKESADLLVARASEHRRPADLVSVEVQHRQHRAVATRIQKARALPRAGERARLGFAITNDRERDGIRIVEDSAERVREHIAQFTTFVNRAWRGHTDVAWYASRR